MDVTKPYKFIGFGDGLPVDGVVRIVLAGGLGRGAPQKKARVRGAAAPKRGVCGAGAGSPSRWS